MRPQNIGFHSYKHRRNMLLLFQQHVACIILLLLCPFLCLTTPTRATTNMLNATKTAKPGCPTKCGNLTIPYPFGIGDGCSLGPAYNITCLTSGTIPVSILKPGGGVIQINSPTALFNGKPVLGISETQVRLKSILSYFKNCFERLEGSIRITPFGEDFRSYAYSTDNKFIVIGCGHYGILDAHTMAGRQIFSCVAVCSKKEDLHDKTCSGIGCCHVALPKGLLEFNISTDRIYTRSFGDMISSGNCSYAIIGEPMGGSKFPAAHDLQDPRFQERTLAKLPVVLDWWVGNHTCKEAQAKQNLTTYACQHNTICIDVDQTLGFQGYRCQCLPGYEGNPYLTPGCTDIDECTGPNNPCYGSCHNTLGNYTCSCPMGYHGDGRKHGVGCIPHKISKTIFGLGFGVGLGSILVLLGGVWLLNVARKRKEILKRARNFKRNGGLLLLQRMSSTEGVIDKTRIFSISELRKATNNFNGNRVIGQGGQGTVYKGMLCDGSVVAIKKSKIVNQRQSDQFINELVLLSQINHRNIVNMLGCCLETEVPILVYEFIPNGTLSKHIHYPSEEFPITWEMRLQIAKDVAEALTYLHSASSKPIFHRDIKTANILLDDKYRAKLSDFGTSRSIEINQTHVTTRVQGTFGYLDPEYFRSHQFTEKSDVYSFGVVLVELLTGEQAVRLTETESPCEESLVSWFLSSMQNSNLEDILALPVINEGEKDIVLEVAKLAKKCLNIDGKQRPTMRVAALELEMINRKNHLSVDHQFLKNPQEAIDETLNEMTNYISDELLSSWTSYTEEDCSFPLN